MDEGSKRVITLMVGEEKFDCSLELLVSSSDYFKGMFSNNYIEGSKDVIELKEMHGGAEIMKIIVQFLHTGKLKCDLDVDTYLLLLASSSMLQITELQKCCTQQVLDRLTIDNCLDVYRIGRYCMTSPEMLVAESSLTLALWKFKDIVQRASSGFWNQPIEAVEDYLGLESGIDTRSLGEWAVIDAVVSWIEVNHDERIKFLPRLLNCIDYSQLTADDINSLLFYDIIDDSGDSKKILTEIKRQKQHPDRLTLSDRERSVENLDCDKMQIVSETCEMSRSPEQLSLADASNKDSDTSSTRLLSSNVERQVNMLLTRKGRHLPLKPSIVGYKLHSYSKIDALQSLTCYLVPVLYTFDLERKCIKEVTALEKLTDGPMILSGSQACAVGPSVYILGGEYQLGHNNWNQHVWSYETIYDSWKVHESLPTRRRHHITCVIDDVIYLLGGLGRYRCRLTSVESLNASTGKWNAHECSPVPLITAAACAYKGRLLVFTDSEMLTYFPDPDKWIITSLKASQPQSYHTAVVYQDYVCLLNSDRNKVYRCSPEDNPVILEFFGTFLNPTINICLVNNLLFSFTHANGLKDGDHIVESMDLDKKPCEARNENGYDEDAKVNDLASGGVYSQIIWREPPTGNYHFLSSDCSVSYSQGCFPLFKVQL